MKKFSFILSLVLIAGSGRILIAQEKQDTLLLKIDSLNAVLSSLLDSVEIKNAEISELVKKINKMDAESRERIIKEKENWRKLEKYMSMKEVEKLLGKPTSIDKFNTYTRWWYGNGYVDFNPFKASTIWSEPRNNRIEVIEH